MGACESDSGADAFPAIELIENFDLEIGECRSQCGDKGAELLWAVHLFRRRCVSILWMRNFRDGRNLALVEYVFDEALDYLCVIHNVYVLSVNR